MTVVQYEPPPPLPASREGEELEQGPIGWVARLRAAAEIAAHIAETDFVPSTLRGNAPAIAAAILYGAEVGLEPMQSLQKVAVIRGRPTLSAEAQRGLVLAAGHELYFEESTATRAIAAGRRRDGERVQRVTWSLEDARRAGIAGGENWRRYPAEMLRARASAALARAMFADVIGGMVASEEIEDEPEDGSRSVPFAGVTPADAERAPATTRRRSRVVGSASPERLSVAPTPPPDSQPPPETPDEPPASEEQRRMIFALMRDVGLPPGDRQSRLDYTSRVLGRAIASSNELTKGDASQVIDDLQELRELPELERMKRLLPQPEAEVISELEQLEAKPVDDESAKEAGRDDIDDIPF
jgi:hypothetical protein